MDVDIRDNFAWLPSLMSEASAEFLSEFLINLESLPILILGKKPETPPGNSWRLQQRRSYLYKSGDACLLVWGQIGGHQVWGGQADQRYHLEIILFMTSDVNSKFETMKSETRANPWLMWKSLNWLAADI